MVIKSTVFKMFSKSSSIDLLQMHMDKVNACAQMLAPFFEATLKGDWKKADTIRLSIAKTEQEADKIKTTLRLSLPKGLFSLVPRPELLTLISMQDLIANKAEDIAGVMYGRQMQLPAELANAFSQFLQRSLDASKQANKAISELEELLVSGFSGVEVKLVRQMIKRLDKIEHDTDSMQSKLCDQLYRIEKSIPPIDVIFLYKVIEWIGELADHAQSVGGRLQLLLAH